MSKELIARLRYLYADGYPITEEAADALEVQQSWLRVKDATIGQMANDMAAAQKRIDDLESEIDRKMPAASYVIEQLAASQAQIKVLRGALEDTFYFLERHSNRWDGVNGKHPNDVAESAREALSTPHDSALRELLKAERERVAKVVRDASFKIQSGSPHRKIFDDVVAEIRAMEDQ